MILNGLTPQEYGEWFDLLFPPHGWVVVYRVVVDESGTDGDAPMISVAACFASGRTWKSFIRQWAPRAGLYRRYHATKAKSDDNEFLADIIGNEIDGLALSISYQDYDAVLPKQKRGVFGTEYVFAIRVIAETLRDYCERRDIRGMAWVLEDGHRSINHARQVIDYLRHNNYRILSQTSVGKEDICTHAADLVSHAVTRATRGDTRLLDIVRPRFFVQQIPRDDLATMVHTSQAVIDQEKRRRERLRAQRKRRGAK